MSRLEANVKAEHAGVVHNVKEAAKAMACDIELVCGIKYEVSKTGKVKVCDGYELSKVGGRYKENPNLSYFFGLRDSGSAIRRMT